MSDLFRYAFFQNALLTGTFIAIVAAVCGYFLVSRGLTFAAHALPNIGFAGAAGAVLLGIKPVYGLFAFTTLSGIGIGLLGRNTRQRDVSIGVLMTFALGLGLMFLSLYKGYAQRVYGILFGTILGIGSDDVIMTAVTAGAVLLFIGGLFRPLVFSTFDPGLAEARGVPVVALSILFLILVAAVVSISVQIMGAMLVFTLLVGPSATANRLGRRPASVIAIAVLLGVGYVWIAVILAALTGDIPVSFFVAGVSFCVYIPIRLLSGPKTSMAIGGVE